MIKKVLIFTVICFAFYFVNINAQFRPAFPMWPTDTLKIGNAWRIYVDDDDSTAYFTFANDDTLIIFENKADSSTIKFRGIDKSVILTVGDQSVIISSGDTLNSPLIKGATGINFLVGTTSVMTLSDSGLVADSLNTKRIIDTDNGTTLDFTSTGATLGPDSTRGNFTLESVIFSGALFDTTGAPIGTFAPLADTAVALKISTGAWKFIPLQP